MGIVDIEKFVGKDEIRESNLLIGEFLGWKLECLNPEEPHNPEEGDFQIWNFHKYENGEIVDSHCGGDNWGWNEKSALHFDYDWNWLMKAYIKIAAMASLCAIEEKVCFIQMGGTYSKEDNCMINCDFSTFQEGKDLRESVWLAVAFFVKWYNTKKEKDETKI